MPITPGVSHAGALAGVIRGAMGTAAATHSPGAFVTNPAEYIAGSRHVFTGCNIKQGGGGIVYWPASSSSVRNVGFVANSPTVVKGDVATAITVPMPYYGETNGRSGTCAVTTSWSECQVPMDFSPMSVGDSTEIDITAATAGVKYSAVVLAPVAQLSSTGTLTAGSFATASDCASVSSPALCGSAAAGSTTIVAGSTSQTVNTTGIGPNSQIIVQQDNSLGSRLGVSCYSGSNTDPFVVSRVAGSSFTFNAITPIGNPACFSYLILNQ